MSSAGGTQPARLERAAVALVGVGGLGCPAALALARAGVRRMTLVDPDRVELSNLPRQLLHRTGDVGRPKVLSGAERLRDAFPGLEVQTREERLDRSSAPALFRAHDLVLDATDGIDTKRMLSDVAVQTGVPLVHGGVLRMEGLALLIRPGGPCLCCLFREPPPPDEVPTCARAGVLGTVAGVVGALQAHLAVQALRAGWQGAEERLHRFDARTLRSRRVRAVPDPECPVCTGAAGDVGARAGDTVVAPSRAGLEAGS